MTTLIAFSSPTTRPRRTPRRGLLAALALLAVGGLAPPAAALPIGLELELGTGVPLAPFPAGVPVSIEDPTGAKFAKIANSAYNVLLDARPVAGFSTGLTLLLGNWYVRAAVSLNTYGKVTMSRYAFSRINGQDLPAAVKNIYVGPIDPPQEVDLGKTAMIVTTRFGFGRRWYLLFESPVRPYIMIGGGGVISVLEDQTRGGLTFHGGLGADVHVHQRLDLGLKLLYEWTGVFLNENFQASSAATAIGKAASSETTLLSAFIASLHTIQIGVTATYRF